MKSLHPFSRLQWPGLLAHLRTSAILGAIGLCIGAVPAQAAKRVHTAYDQQVTTIAADRGAQQAISSAAIHPFATREQRARVKPLAWKDDAEPASADDSVVPQLSPLMRPSRSSGGGSPGLGNYLARTDFPSEWKSISQREPQSRAAPSDQHDNVISPMDGAHYPFVRLLGNYYTSRWQAPPWNKIGKLYFTTPGGGSSYCTANVASGNSVLITAAHCVYTRGAGFNSNFVFVPAERYGAAPYGSYGWSSASVMNNWITNGGRRWDVAVIRLSGERSSGRPVTDYVGWLGRAWNYGYSQYMYSIGYASNFSTQYTNMCAGQTYSSGWEGTNVLVQGCDMTYGSSGGGWLMNYTPNSHGGNHVNSVVSGPHIGDFGRSYVGARFNDDNIVPLCNAIGC